MLILYRIAIFVYGLLVWISSLSNTKARKFRAGRRNWENKLLADFQYNSQQIIWIHVASLGEFEQGRPIIEALKRARGTTKILLTFFSPSGYEVRKNYEYADWVHYLPLDTPENARKFVSIVHPTLVIFIKYEFWYYFLKELKNQQIPILMASCIFRKNHFFFRRSGSFFKPILKGVDHFFVQDDESFRLITSITDKATVAGDTRFDRVIEISEQASAFKRVDEFLDGEKCFMIGSSWQSDLKILFPFIKKYQSDVKFIIAPHNIADGDISSLVNQLEGAVRYSKPENLKKSRTLIIDNIGMLSSLYKYANYAFVGGGFRGTLHNTLEAAVYGVPVFFGKHANNEKFKEALELIKCTGAFSVSTFAELNEKFQHLLKREEDYTSSAQAAHRYVRSKSGATRQVMKRVLELI